MSSTVSRKTYIAAWAILMLLLVATWGASRVDLNPFNAAIAMTIAVGKMLLIMLYFMHVRYSPKTTWLFAAAGFVWLLILLDLTLSDYLTRGFSWSQ